MKIFDCFIFFNELELLDLRLMTMYEVVDYFVIVEANRTHTGGTKDFIFEQNKDKFLEYLDKIIYVKVEDLPNTYARDAIWGPENFQRLCIERGLISANVGDKIIVSDADEIPNPDVIIKHLDTKDSVPLQQKLFYYYVNCMQNQLWSAPVMLTRGYYKSVQDDRMAAFYSESPIPDGGWHYSYMGGAEKIRLKVENIAESYVVINSVGSISDIETKMTTQQDLLGRSDPLFKKQIVDITKEGMAPVCIDKFIEKYPSFYYSGGAAT